MNSTRQSSGKIISSGLAIFAMLFGAGNVPMPLLLGRDAGTNIGYGLLGFLLVGALLPLIGFITIMLFEGDYKKFLDKIGTIPSNIVILLCMIMIGPFMGVPRCITLSYASFKTHVPGTSLLLFSIIAAILVFIFAIRKNKVADLLGCYFGPIKIGLLLAIVGKGLLNPIPLINTGISATNSFMKGIFCGSITGDLLGTIFFSSIIFAGLKNSLGKSVNNKALAIAGLKAGGLGVFLLGFVYTGFCFVAAFKGQQLVGVDMVDLYTKISALILGEGGLLADITIITACFGTSIALMTIFSSYLYRDVFFGRVAYLPILITTALISIAISNIGFGGIAMFAGIVFMAIYPALMILAIVNFAHVMFGFKWIKIPFFATLAGTILFQYGSYLKDFAFIQKIGLAAWF
jgi:branched-chain amino acid:cation transporter, LIVCS family